MNNYRAVGFGLALLLTGCVTTSSSSVESDIHTYNYDHNMRMVSKERVKALKTEVSNSDTNKTEVGLTLKYKDKEDESHKLLIRSESIDAFRDLLILKASVPNDTIDSPTKFNLGTSKVDVVAGFARGERIISIGSLNGVFAFQEKDIKDILRLLDGIQHSSE